MEFLFENKDDMKEGTYNEIVKKIVELRPKEQVYKIEYYVTKWHEFSCDESHENHNDQPLAYTMYSTLPLFYQTIGQFDLDDATMLSDRYHNCECCSRLPRSFRVSEYTTSNFDCLDNTSNYFHYTKTVMVTRITPVKDNNFRIVGQAD